MSGTPLKPFTLATLRALRPLLPASIPIFGCGGISSGADALEYAKEGATAVQLYTSFGYDGVGTCRRIKDELVDLLKQEGTTWAELVKKSVLGTALAIKYRASSPTDRCSNATAISCLNYSIHIDYIAERVCDSEKCQKNG